MTLIALLALQCVAAMAAFDYGITLDAGSTGTRIYLYKWPARRSPYSLTVLPPFSEPITEATWSMKIDSPLAWYNATPDEAGPGLKNLTAHIMMILEELGDASAASRTPIFLGATAGMRVLPLLQREGIIASVRNWLASDDCPFMFSDPSWARVISGEEEGVFGWLTTNYVLGRLGLNSTVGALDMGGASTQISFVPGSDIMANLFSLDLGRSELAAEVYTHSFLSFGLDQISNRLEALLSDGAAPGSLLVNPCLPSDYSETSMVNGSLFNFTGSSSSAECSAILQGFLGLEEQCFYEQCSVTGVYQPPVQDLHMYAFSGYASVLGTLSMAKNVSLGELQSVVASACTLNWTALQRMYPDEGNLPYLHTACRSGTYIGQLLSAYGFPLAGTSITFTNKVTNEHGDEYSLGWSLGHMLYHANRLGWMLEGEDCDSKQWLYIVAAALGVVALMFLVVTVVLCCALRRNKHQFDYHQPA